MVNTCSLVFTQAPDTCVNTCVQNTVGTCVIRDTSGNRRKDVSAQLSGLSCSRDHDTGCGLTRSHFPESRPSSHPAAGLRRALAREGMRPSTTHGFRRVGHDDVHGAPLGVHRSV